MELIVDDVVKDRISAIVYSVQIASLPELYYGIKIMFLNRTRIPQHDHSECPCTRIGYMIPIFATYIHNFSTHDALTVFTTVMSHLKSQPIKHFPFSQPGNNHILMDSDLFVTIFFHPSSSVKTINPFMPSFSSTCFLLLP